MTKAPAGEGCPAHRPSRLSTRLIVGTSVPIGCGSGDVRGGCCAGMRRLVPERLGITPDEIDGGHLVALSRPKELAQRLERYVNEYVTATVAGQLFGLPILRVQDVFVPERLTRVPLAPPEIAGVLNLRGRIVTLIDMCRRLELPRTTIEAQPMAIGVEVTPERSTPLKFSV